MEHFDRDVVYLWQLQPTVHVTDVDGKPHLF